MGLPTNKTAVLIGAASACGFGKATAALFAEHGATAAVLDPDRAAAEAAAADPGEGPAGFACDVADLEACRAAAATLEARWGGIDIQVDDAGITKPLKIMDIGPANCEAVADVSLRGTLYTSRAVIPGMHGRGTGSIVNLSSVSAQRGGGVFGGPHHSAARAGAPCLTEAVARGRAPKACA